MSKIIQLPIVVTHNVKVVEYKNVAYVRTRDIADALGVKQPFEFTSDIRKSLGGHVVLSGEDTKEFRGGTDNTRTPYIKVSDMIEFLERGIMKHKTNGTRQEVLNVLQAYMNIYVGMNIYED